MNPFAEVDTETVTNEQGGSQSRLEYDWRLVPWKGMLPVVKRLMAGAEKYGRENWRDIPEEDHVAHAHAHALGALNCTGDDRLNHLYGVVARALFAIETAADDGNKSVSAYTATPGTLRGALLRTSTGRLLRVVDVDIRGNVEMLPYTGIQSRLSYSFQDILDWEVVDLHPAD